MLYSLQQRLFAVKKLFQVLALSLVLLHLDSVFGQKEAPAVSKLDPAMDVNKKAAADLDWHDVTQWGLEGRILPKCRNCFFAGQPRSSLDTSFYQFFD